MLSDGPIAAITMEVGNLLKLPAVSNAAPKVDTILSVILQVTASIIAAPLSLPASIISGLTAVHTFVYNLEDLLDNGKLDQSVK